MKKLLCIALVVVAQTVFAGAPLKMLGHEADYAATAIEQIGTNGVGSATGSYGVAGGQGLFGWYLRRVDPTTWPVVPQLVAVKLKAALQSDGWETFEAHPIPEERLIPVQFMVSAARKGDSLEVIVTLVPTEKDSVAVSYSQRRFPSPVDRTDAQSGPTAPPKGSEK